MNLRGGLLWSVGPLLGLTVLCACGGGASSAVPANRPAAAPSTSAPTATRLAQPADPPAAGATQPVSRNGGTPHPSVRSSQGGFSTAAQVSYPDGVTVSVTAVKQAVERGQGLGALPGRPNIELLVTLSNRSRVSVDLTRVVVTTTYGSPALLAAPVYDDPSVRDFAQTVKPGRSGSTTYAFAVPAGQRGKVVTVVDFDDRHVPARFVGSLR